MIMNEKTGREMQEFIKRFHTYLFYYLLDDIETDFTCGDGIIDDTLLSYFRNRYGTYAERIAKRVRNGEFSSRIGAIRITHIYVRSLYDCTDDYNAYDNTFYIIASFLDFFRVYAENYHVDEAWEMMLPYTKYINMDIYLN